MKKGKATRTAAIVGVVAVIVVLTAVIIVNNSKKALTQEQKDFLLDATGETATSTLTDEQQDILDCYNGGVEYLAEKYPDKNLALGYAKNTEEQYGELVMDITEEGSSDTYTLTGAKTKDGTWEYSDTYYLSLTSDYEAAMKEYISSKGHNCIKACTEFYGASGANYDPKKKGEELLSSHSAGNLTKLYVVWENPDTAEEEGQKIERELEDINACGNYVIYLIDSVPPEWTDIPSYVDEKFYETVMLHQTFSIV